MHTMKIGRKQFRRQNENQRRYLDMQYFKNTPRRAMDHQHPRDAGMFPLCRNDADDRMGCMRERQNGCSCAFPRNDEPARICKDPAQSERMNPCDCADNKRSERTNGHACMDKDRVERNSRCGCMGTDRLERMNDCEDMNQSHRCENTPTAEHYECMGLAMAFVPDHEFEDTNEAEEALCRGSLFQKLDMPFYGQRRRNCK